MFINITTLGKTLIVNKEAITVARPARLNRAEGIVEYVPLISILPGKEMEIELAGQPFLNENDCLNALRTLLGLATTETTFLVKFFVDGVKIDEQEVAKGATLTGITDPTNAEGEQFVGWTLNNAPFDLDTPVESNLILFAEFEPIVEHEVTFVWGHGIDDETDFVIEGTVIEAPEAKTVEGYDFIGWFNEGVEFNFTTPITENLVLVADWEEAPEIGLIPSRYVQTTLEDFDENGDYIGTEEYIILPEEEVVIPEDRPFFYNIINPNIKGVAASGDYLTNTSGMFANNESLYLELDYLDTSNVTNMLNMFDNSQATTLDLSSFNTRNVRNAIGMFQDSQATTLDLSSFDTSNVTNMNAMFGGSEATTLDLSSFDTSNVVDMEGMFQDSQATTLDLSSFDTSNVTTMAYMFWGSEATTLDLSSFDTSNVVDMEDMFQDSQATIGYARTQADANKFNNSSNKPAALTFIVKEDTPPAI